MSSTDSTLDTAKQRASEMAEDARDTATAKAREEAEKVRADAINEADDAASATRAAESQFDDDSLQAAALRQIGAQINSVADQMRDKPVDAMVDDVAVFARRNPMLFLGGAALAGFAAARFLKSGSGTPTRTQASAHDPWAGHLDDVERYQ
jgi:hypothetical protein